MRDNDKGVIKMNIDIHIKKIGNRIVFWKYEKGKIKIVKVTRNPYKNNELPIIKYKINR